MPIITLLTDFGLQDGYVGVMKGVIWGIIPGVQIVDLTHDIAPQNVMQGSFILGRSARYFPAGTIHVGVVDPGVGTRRRPVATRLGDSFFVGPDNGLITHLLNLAECRGDSIEFSHLDAPAYWLPEVSNVFHGRDIFAPVSAHLAEGVPLAELGTPITDPLRLELPMPHPLDKGWRGQIIHIDRFGNLETNIERSHMQAFVKPSHVRVGDYTITGLQDAFGDGKPDQLVALVDSADHLSICVVNGSAAERVLAQVGDPVEIVSDTQSIFPIISL